MILCARLVDLSLRFAFFSSPNRVRLRAIKTASRRIYRVGNIVLRRGQSCVRRHAIGRAHGADRSDRIVRPSASQRLQKSSCRNDDNRVLPRRRASNAVGQLTMVYSSPHSAHSLAGQSEERVCGKKRRILHPDIPSCKDG